MKKFLAILAAGVLAAAMCAGFVACGEEDGNGGGTGEADGGIDNSVGGTDSSIGSGTDGTENKDIVINANTNFADIVSDKVTDEEWNAVFAMDEHGSIINAQNYKYSCIYKGEGDLGEKFEVSVDNLKAYCKVYAEANSSEYVERYYNIEDIYSEIAIHEWEYVYENGVWTKQQSYDAGAMLWGFAFSYAGAYDIGTGELLPVPEYDEELKAYVRTVSFWDGQENKYIVKLKDGKLCAHEFYVNDEFVMRTIVYDYGKESVTLPTVAE